MNGPVVGLCEVTFIPFSSSDDSFPALLVWDKILHFKIPCKSEESFLPAHGDTCILVECVTCVLCAQFEGRGKQLVSGLRQYGPLTLL